MNPCDKYINPEINNAKSEVVKRPLFKGSSHLIAFFIYLGMYKRLIKTVPLEISTSIKFYLLSEIGHFGCSSLLHLFNWPRKWVDYPRKMDHIMILIKILASYEAVVATVLTNINPLIIRFVHIGTLFGIIGRLLYVNAPEWIISLPCFITGWSILLDPHCISLLINRTPVGSLLLSFVGLFHSIGGYIYVKKSPELWQEYFGYHELFHLLTMTGTLCFTRYIFSHALPYYSKNILTHAVQ